MHMQDSGDRHCAHPSALQNITYVLRDKTRLGGADGTPKRIRTAVSTLKGWRPGPLDDGGCRPFEDTNGCTHGHTRVQTRRAAAGSRRYSADVCRGPAYLERAATQEKRPCPGAPGKAVCQVRNGVHVPASGRRASLRAVARTSARRCRRGRRPWAGARFRWGRPPALAAVPRARAPAWGPPSAERPSAGLAVAPSAEPEAQLPWAATGWAGGAAAMGWAGAAIGAG